MVETARYAATSGEWEDPPRLYALVRRKDLGALESALPVGAKSADEDTLIPSGPDPLREGQPEDALARVHGPPEVTGSPLVTVFRVSPPDKDSPFPMAMGVIVPPGGLLGRLTVGVVRAGQSDVSYACALQLQGETELLVGPDPADSLVTALIGTL